MAKIISEKVNVLSIREIKKKLSNSVKKLNLNDANSGNQPENTIIIGEFKNVVAKKNSNLPPKDLMKIALTEILENGHGKYFHVFFYDKFVHLFEKILKDVNDSPAWVVFSNVQITTYIGREKNWSPYSLKVRENGNQEVVLFIQANSPSEPLLNYVPVSEVISGAKQNVFAVVREVVKPLTILGNQSKHTMVALTDQSCFKATAKRADILLHVFLNDPNDNFPQTIEVGNILRVRDLLGDFYKKERMHGKIFNSKAVTFFNLIEDDDKVTPITTNSKYVLTDQDQEYVQNLRRWWLEKQEEAIVVNNTNSSTDSILLEKMICELTEPCTFNLHCLITDIRIVDTYSVVLLKVTDGSTCPVFTTITSFENATQELVADPVNVIFQPKEIDINVFEPLYTEAVKLKKGDFIELVNVTCVSVESESEEFGHPALDFFMKSTFSRIIRLKENSWWPRKIKKLIKTNEASDEKISNDKSLSPSNNQKSNSRSLTADEASDESISDNGALSPSRNQRSNSRLLKRNKASDDKISDNESLSPSSNKKRKCRLLDAEKASNKRKSDNEALSPSKNQGTEYRLLSADIASDERLSDSEAPSPSKNQRCKSRPLNVDKASDEKTSDNKSPSPSKNRRSKASLSVHITPTGREILSKSFSQPLNSDAVTSTPRRTTCAPGEQEDQNNQDKNASSPNLADGPPKTCLFPSPIKRAGDTNGTTGGTNKKAYSALNENFDMLNNSNISEHLEPKLKKEMTEERDKNEVFVKSYLHTDCGDYSLSSLREFYQRSKNGDKAVVWAFLKEFEFPSKESCPCSDLICFHNWTWGLCCICRSVFSPDKLRAMYTEEELRKNNYLLHCKECRKSNSDLSRENSDTVLPFMRFELRLQDMSSEESFFAYLDGDAAEKFFGVECDFSWTVDKVPSVLRKKATILKTCGDDIPKKFCLLNAATSDGDTTIQIVETSSLITCVYME